MEASALQLDEHLAGGAASPVQRLCELERDDVLGISLVERSSLILRTGHTLVPTRLAAGAHSLVARRALRLGVAVLVEKDADGTDSIGAEEGG